MTAAEDMAGLAERLQVLAAQRQTTTYGALAKDLGIAPLSRLTTALEALMAEDAASGLPFRAALVCARLTPGLPAPGFFDKAAALGRPFPADPRAALDLERAALAAAASSSLHKYSHGGAGV